MASLISLLVFILIFPFVVFTACGMLGICLKPDRLRPPWLDWGLDDKKDEKDEESSE